MMLAVGYAWVFERGVVYALTVSDVVSVKPNNRKNFGKVLGVVKGIIPVPVSSAL